jgi:hypothetical protein
MKNMTLFEKSLFTIKDKDPRLKITTSKLAPPPFLSAHGNLTTQKCPQKCVIFDKMQSLKTLKGGISFIIIDYKWKIS